MYGVRSKSSIHVDVTTILAYFSLKNSTPMPYRFAQFYELQKVIEKVQDNTDMKIAEKNKR